VFVSVVEYLKLADCTTVKECKQQVESEMCVYVFVLGLYVIGL
jgi:hypothetical protein